MRHVLALNAGSSTLRFSLFAQHTTLTVLLAGVIDRIGSNGSTISMTHAPTGPTGPVALSAPDHISALDDVLHRIGAMAIMPDAVGHRIVHGGDRYRTAQLVDPAMLAELHRIVDLDPEHLPTELALIDAVTAAFPDTPQVACFDTEFHRALPRVAQILPIPRRYEAMGIHRFGFHGLSYAYLMQELASTSAKEACGRIILAHLGNGASMSAVHRQQCVDTTMGFTPAGGLVMGTRAGDLDPGVSTFLSRRDGLTAVQFDHMVTHESGLLGVSETSGDMRDLLQHEQADVRAAEAVALFCYQARKNVGAYAAAMGGVDTIIFAGGIGEHAAVVRARICEHLEFLGVVLDPARNEAQAPVISVLGSPVTIRVMHTDEDVMIARLVDRVLHFSA